MKKITVFILGVCCFIHANTQNLTSPKSRAEAEKLWKQVDRKHSQEILDKASEKQISIIANFNPCPKDCMKDGEACETCSCGGGICQMLYISEGIEDEMEDNEGAILVQRIGNNQLEIVLTDRIAYDEKMSVLIGENILLDESICEALGFENSTAKIAYGHYKIMPANISQYGKIMVTFELFKSDSVDSETQEDSSTDEDIEE